MADLEAIPHHLRHSDGAMVRKGLADISSFVLAQQREAANLGYAYPAEFSDHVLQGADDEHIAATVGIRGSRKARADRRPRPVLSRRFDYVRQIAVHAYYEWGFNVLALDFRSFGLTNLTSQAPTTVGWKEGEEWCRGALPEAARSDHGGRAGDLARRLRGPRRLPRR